MAKGKSFHWFKQQQQQQHYFDDMKKRSISLGDA